MGPAVLVDALHGMDGQQRSGDNRAKVEGGVLIRAPSGWGVRAAGTYDGIGSGDFDSYGGSLWINVPLN